MVSDSTAAPLFGPATAPLLHVMTLNVRLARPQTTATNADHWPSRALVLQALLRREQPQVLATQEVLFHQLPVLRAALDTHDWVGIGREGGSLGELNPVFYHRRRLELTGFDFHWLSDTPRCIGSTSWGNRVPRILTECRFTDRSTGRRLRVLNTHLDHESERARQRSAGFIARLVNDEPDLPTVVMGDFNAPAPESETHRILTDNDLRDSWRAAQRRMSKGWGTFPDYRPPVNDGPVIDWIMVGPGINVAQTARNVFTHHGQAPSDHLPVQVSVWLTDGGPEPATD